MKITYIVLISLLLGLSQNIAVAADFSASYNAPQSISHKSEVKKTSKKTLSHKQQVKSKRLARKYADNIKQQHQSHDKGSGAAMVLLVLLMLGLLVGLGFVIGWLWVLWIAIIALGIIGILFIVESIA